MTDAVKVQFAVELTRCEIMTAGKELPKNCEHLGPKNLTPCVESLASINQMWTSYSGYFRDVTFMCLGVRLTKEKEHLKGLYRNVTFALITEHKFKERRDEDLSSWKAWMQDLRTLQLDVVSSLDAMTVLINQFENQIITSLHSVSEHAKAIMSTLQNTFEGETHKAASHVCDMAKETINKALHPIEEQLKRLSDMSSAMSTLAEVHQVLQILAFYSHVFKIFLGPSQQLT
ncbi:karyogamy protein [Phlyctochytrium planicorne]|nr:karyogamy protein [Phlyctochytrium planicorne]